MCLDALASATQSAAAAVEQRKKVKATRSAIYKKAQQYVKEYKAEVRRLLAGSMQSSCEDVAKLASRA